MDRGQYLRHALSLGGLPGQTPPHQKPDDNATINANGSLTFKRAKGAWGVFVVGGKDPVVVVTSTTTPTFSRSDPTRLYTVGGETTHTIQTVVLHHDGTVARIEDTVNLDHLGLGLPLLAQVGGIGASDTGLVFYFGGLTPNTHPYVGVWLERESAPAYLRDTRHAPLGFLLHEAHIDLTGRYIVLDPASGPSTWTLDLIEHTATISTPGPPTQPEAAA